MIKQPLARHYDLRLQELYEDEVLEFLEENGFSGINGPVESYHGDDCLYPIAPGPERDEDAFLL